MALMQRQTRPCHPPATSTCRDLPGLPVLISHKERAFATTVRKLPNNMHGRLESTTCACHSRRARRVRTWRQKSRTWRRFLNRLDIVAVFLVLALRRIKKIKEWRSAVSRNHAISKGESRKLLRCCSSGTTERTVFYLEGNS